MTKTPPTAPRPFYETHCMKCQAGWVTATTENPLVVVCLLNREPVPEDITSCNKFEANAA